MSKKEAWKKKLGISEYPWSSDDDEDDSSTKSSPHRVEPLASRLRLNGTSDPILSGHSHNAPPSSESQSLSTATKKASNKKDGESYWQSYWRALPKHSTSSPVTNAPSTSRKAPTSAGASSSSAVQKAQDKRDRDSFWASMNGPNRFAAMLTLSKNSNYASRNPSNPGPSRSASSEPRIQGASFVPSAPLSRSLPPPVHTTLSTATTPGCSTDRHADLHRLMESRNVMLKRCLEATNKSTANLVSVSRILLKAKRRSRDQLARTSSASTPRTVAEIRSRHCRAPEIGGVGPPSRPAPPAASVSVEHSEDEIHLSDFSPDETDGNDDIRRESLRATDATGAPAVALEEEIVEIATEAETSLGTEAETSGEVVETGGGGSAAEVASPPGGTDEGTPQPHGVKRKRSSDEDDDHSAVKKLNQSLLKLLECPVCFECMAPPLSQCRRGHLVCGKCRARLANCPVCRAAFSSVRNRAMEGVTDMVRYPCRHNCGREVKLRKRASHEASCCARRYRCPVPACSVRPMRKHELPAHAESKHMSILILGKQHDMALQVNSEEKRNFLVYVYGELFHLKLDLDVRTLRLMLTVTYLGPLNNASKYTYQVVVTGLYNSRKLVYSRETHSDLESSALYVSRQDCFHMSIDQAVNFLRVRNKPCEQNQTLNLSVEILENQTLQQNDGANISDV